LIIYSVIPDFNISGTENLVEIATLCGSEIPSARLLSDSNEILVRLNTFQKSKDLYKGFKLFYNISKVSCGGSLDSASGILQSPGYPSSTLNKAFCEWKITAPKGRRVKIEFLDIDFLVSNNQFLQRIGIYNDFRYSSRLKFLTNNSVTEPIYSSDNRIMITLWIRVASSNRGFQLKFTSDEQTICAGSLNDVEGTIFPPINHNLTSYTCEYLRDVKPISGTSLTTGTLAFYFRNILVGKKISNCRFAATALNVIHVGGLTEVEQTLGRICGNSTSLITILSPFPDVKLEVKQSPYFGPITFDLNYKSFPCGGIIESGQVNNIKNPSFTTN